MNGQVFIYLNQQTILSHWQRNSFGNLIMNGRKQHLFVLFLGSYRHTEINQKTGTAIYLADPQSNWQ